MPGDKFEFQELLVHLSTSDIYTSHLLIYFLLTYYFVDDSKFLKINSKIQNLIKSIISLCKPRFMIDFFMKGLSSAKINNPIENIRRLFKIYTPTIKQTEGNVVMGRHDFKPSDLDDSEYIEELYMSGIYFWVDIHEIAKRVDHSQPKKAKRAFIIENLNRMNKKLPSLVYFNTAGKFKILLRSGTQMPYSNEDKHK